MKSKLTECSTDLRELLENELQHVRMLSSIAEENLKKESEDILCNAVLDSTRSTQSISVRFRKWQDSDAVAYWRLEFVLPTLTRLALLTAIMVILDQRLEHTCQSLYKILQLSLKRKDLRGEGLLLSRDYLRKVAGITSDQIESDLEELEILQRIRNLWIHNGGALPLSNESKNKNNDIQIRCYKHVKIDSENFIQAEPSLIPRALELAKQIGSEYANQIDKLSQQVPPWRGEVPHH